MNRIDAVDSELFQTLEKIFRNALDDERRITRIWRVIAMSLAFLLGALLVVLAVMAVTEPEPSNRLRELFQSTPTAQQVVSL